MSKEFALAKEKALRRLREEIEKVDTDIISLLEILNSSKHFYTTSSCSGRIIVLEVPKVGMKKEAKFLGKWHDSVNLDEVMEAIRKYRKGLLWFMAQPPIMHVVADDVEKAKELLELSRKSGFKNSCIKSLGKKILVEIESTERFDVPIGRDGKIFCDENFLEMLCELGNELLKRSKSKLSLLEKLLRELIIGQDQKKMLK